MNKSEGFFFTEIGTPEIEYEPLPSDVAPQVPGRRVPPPPPKKKNSVSFYFCRPWHFRRFPVLWFLFLSYSDHLSLVAEHIPAYITYWLCISVMLWNLFLTQKLTRIALRQCSDIWWILGMLVPWPNLWLAYKLILILPVASRSYERSFFSSEICEKLTAHCAVPWIKTD